MFLNNRVHVIGFAIILGGLAYLASGLWSAVFIVTLPLDLDAVTDAIEIEAGADRFGNVHTTRRPIEFKNSLEELKYFHNMKMLERNKYWVGGLLIFGGIVGTFSFYQIPKWRNALDPLVDTPVAVFGSFILGMSVVLIVPLLLSWILPTPATWFPQEIRAISELRQKAALDQIESLAAQLEAETAQDAP